MSFTVKTRAGIGGITDAWGKGGEGREKSTQTEAGKQQIERRQGVQVAHPRSPWVLHYMKKAKKSEQRNHQRDDTLKGIKKKKTQRGTLLLRRRESRASDKKASLLKCAIISGPRPSHPAPLVRSAPLSVNPWRIVNGCRTFGTDSGKPD